MRKHVVAFISTTEVVNGSDKSYYKEYDFDTEVEAKQFAASIRLINSVLTTESCRYIGVKYRPDTTNNSTIFSELGVDDFIEEDLPL